MSVRSLKLRLAAPAFLTGCSFFLQDVYVEQNPPVQPICSDGYGYAIVDVVIAALAASSFYTFTRCSSSSDDDSCLGEVLGAVFLSTPGVITFGLSAIYGFTRANRCAAAKEAWGTQTIVVPPKPPPPPPPSPAPPPPDPPPANPPDPMK